MEAVMEEKDNPENAGDSTPRESDCENKGAPG